MGIATQTLLTLVEAVARENGDYVTVETTTNITTDNDVISTTLQEYDSGRDGFFDTYWCYLPDEENAGTERKTGLPGTTTYATSTGTLTLMGGALAAESAAVTVELFKYPRDYYKRAVIEACKQIFPMLHKELDNQTLITGNILPDGHLDSWSSSTALTYWTTSNITLERTSTASAKRGGDYSAKCTAGATGAYIYVTSADYPRLKELQGQTVDAYAWAYPGTADDPSIVIYTLQPDGTTQTLASTTSAPASKWTELKLENQALNDDLQTLEFRLKVATDTQVVYFDDAYLGGIPLTQYLLPDAADRPSRAFIQTDCNSTEAFYDPYPFIRSSGDEMSFRITSDGAYRYVEFPTTPINERRIRLLGYEPLETLSADTDTVTLDAWRVPLLTAKARQIFWERMITPLNKEDLERVQREASRARSDYQERLATMRMPTPVERIKTRRND